MPHTRAQLSVRHEQLAAFCERWGVRELSVFGSTVRGEARDDSDVDVLVSFLPGRGITFDNRVEMIDQLEALFGRRVDLADERLLRNPFRRHAILKSREILYAA